MTQNKNKKGIAKKALSISLVAAMLATSNVPVWASGFEAVDPTAEGFAVESAAPETEVVESAENTTVATAQDEVITEDDVNFDLSLAENCKDSQEWADSNNNAPKFEITGTITNKSDSSTVGWWEYGWQATDNPGVNAISGRATKVADMNFVPKKDMAGHSYTLHIWRNEGNVDIEYNTGITVTVENRKLEEGSITGLGDTNKYEYNGFSQSLDLSNIAVTDEYNAAVDKNDYTVYSQSGVNAGDEMYVTVTAKAGSGYEGSVTSDIREIQKRTRQTGDLISSVKEGLTYQYTGSAIEIDKEDVSLTESMSENNGADGKLRGDDLSSAITKAETASSAVGSHVVNVYFDTAKLDNFKPNSPDSVRNIPTTQKVTIEKRDLANTEVYLDFGAIQTNTSREDFIKNLNFVDPETGATINLIEGVDYSLEIRKGTEIVTGSLDQSGDYTATFTAVSGSNTTVNSQTLDFKVTGNVVKELKFSKNYTSEYTGEAIEPSQEDLGTLTVYGHNGKDEKLSDDDWRIVGYTNNINASETPSNPEKAGVQIEILDGMFAGNTVTYNFNIAQLKVKPENISVPTTITYNKAYKDAADYQVPVTVVAKDKNETYTLTLSESDYKVEYAYENKTDGNKVENSIVTTITVLNDNFKANANPIKAEGKTQIVTKALTDAMIHVDPSSYTYTGGNIIPEFEVIDGSIVLYEDEEYTSVITDNVNVGTGKITVTGVTNVTDNSGYYGTASATFEITPADINSVKAEIADQDYTGKQVRPRAFKVTLNGNDVTSQFEIAGYGENVNPGTGTVNLRTVDGNKNFSGDTVTAEFNIIQDKVTGVLDIYDAYGNKITDDKDAKTFEFDGTEKTFAKALLSNVKTTDAKKEEVDADNFEILYLDNISGQYSADGNNKAYIYAVAKAGSGYTGTKEISMADGTKIKGVVDYIEFTITSVKFDASNVTVKNGVYAGGLPVKPEILVQINGNTLVEGVDYEVVLTDTYTEVTNGKTLNVTVNGLGGYSKSTSGTLKWGIDKKDLSDCNVTLENGVLTVMNGLVLVPSEEYTTTDNENGSITVKAAANSKNYTGSVTVYESVPETPDATTLTVTDRTTSTVSLSWDKVEGAEGYTIWFRSEYDTEMSRKIIFDGDQTTWTQTGLQPGTKYFYAMRAWVKDAEGNYIFSDVSPTQRGTTKPIAARIASVSVSNGKIKVNLAGEAAGAEMYSMCYGDSRTCFAANDFKVGIRTQYTTRTLTPTFEPGTYYVCVKSYRDLGNGKRVYGAWSNTFRAVVK